MAPSEELKRNLSRAVEILETLPSRGEEWGARVMFVCETIWDALEHDSLVSHAQCQAFIDVLKDPEALPLARAMIPELRDIKEAVQTTSSRKLEITRLVGVHDRLPSLCDLADSAMYRAEKNAFYDADVYRTKLLLRKSENFSDGEIADLRKWFDTCPVKHGRE